MGIAEQQVSSLGIVIRDPSHAFLADRALLGFDHAIGLLFSKYNSEYMQLEVWGATAPLAAVIFPKLNNFDWETEFNKQSKLIPVRKF